MSVIEEQLNRGERALKVIKRSDQLDDDLTRLAISMRRLLIRRYSNPSEREAAAVQIMQKVKAVA